MPEFIMRAQPPRGLAAYGIVRRQKAILPNIVKRGVKILRNREK